MRTLYFGLCALAIGFVFLCLAGCASRGNQAVVVQQGGSAPPELPTTITIAPSSMPVPEGVGADLWQQLTAELERQLIELRNASRVGGNLVLRNVSTPPLSNSSKTLLSKTGSQLQWNYYSNGDYDQNSEVNLADLAQLALHFQESALPFKFSANSLNAVIDGDGNGEINLADITPIALNFQNNVRSYKLYRSQDSADYPTGPDAGNGSADLVSSHWFSTATGDRGNERLQFSASVPEGLNVDYLWVRPVDNDGVEGIASNLAGPYSTIFTMEGHVYLAGGGTDPLPGVPVELSEDANLIATSVTDVNGHYSFDDLPAGNYTITPTGDPYGYTPENINVTITNADKYLSPIYPAPVDIVHTWVVDDNWSMSAFRTVIDEQNNVFLLGDTPWGIDKLIFVLKYDMFGNLLWRETRQFGLEQIASELLVDATGNIYLGGSYTAAPDDGPNRRYEDLFVLKLDGSGNDLWFFTYSSTTPNSTDETQVHNDNMEGMVFDPQGNLVIGSGAGGLDRSPGFFLKVSPDGELLEENYFILETNDYSSFSVNNINIDPLGNIYASGNLSVFLDYPAMLMKVGTDGQVSWLNHWGSEYGYDSLQTAEVRFGDDGSVFAVSWMRMEESVLEDTHLAKLTPEGDVTWESRVSTGTALGQQNLAIGPMGKLWVSQTELFPYAPPANNTVPFLMSFDQGGNFRFARRWYDSENWNQGIISDIAINSYGVAVMVGSKGSQTAAWETPEVTLAYPQPVQSTQPVIPNSAVGIVDPDVVVTDPGVQGEEDSQLFEKNKALIMYYRP